MGATAFAIDVSTPAIPATAEALGVEFGAIQLTISLYMLGYGAGQIPMGMLADHLGRRPVVLIAMSIFVLAGVMAAYSTSVTMLLGARLIQGLCAASGAVIARAIVRDITSGTETGRLMGLLSATLGGVMVAAPILGALILTQFGWSAPFLASALFGAIGVVLMALFVPETLANPPGGRLIDRFSKGVSAFMASPKSLVGAAHIGLTFCILITFVTFSSEIFIVHFQTTAFGYSVIFAIASVGYLMGGLISRHLIVSHHSLTLSRYIAAAFAIGALMLVLSHITGTDSLYSLAAIMLWLFICVGAMLSTATTLALESLPETAGMAAAIMGTFQILMGSACAAILAAINLDTLVLLKTSAIGFAMLIGIIAFATRKLAGNPS